MQDVSASGFTLALFATKTFPASTLITQFADDADPFDMAAVAVAETAMDINGNLITWSAPTPQEITINVLAGSEEDKNLSIILEANLAKRGRRPAGDVITIVASYANGDVLTARNGKITQGIRGSAIASAGRMKSKTFTFVFQDFDMVRV